MMLPYNHHMEIRLLVCLILGSYCWEFVNPGVYHYWSGPVNSYGDIVMRGMVEVVRKTSFTANLTVKIGDQEPAYQMGLDE